jgi:glycosidase
VIYEISTHNFTSPDGPESGTFKRVEQRLSYLSALGVNGIWVTGHNLADPSHFYNPGVMGV